MAAVISLKGIDQAIANLDYQNEKTLKYGLVHAIRRHYEDESSIGSIQDIDAEELVKVLWDKGDDPAIIKAKRKNLSSIKSSVNADLKRLYKDEKNPEGITIGRSNLFVMGSEAKDQLLTTLTNIFASDAKGDATVNLGQIVQALNIVSKMLSSRDVLADDRSSDGPIELEELRSTIEGLADKVGLGGKEPGELPQASENEQGLEAVEDDAELAEDVEIVEEVLAEEEEKPEEVEEAEEIGEDALEEVLEEVGLDEPPEEAEEALDEAEVEADLEEVEDDAEIVDEAEVVEEVVPEGEEEIEEADEDEVVKDLQEAEVEEDLEEMEAAEDLAEAELDEEVEEVDEGDAEIVEEVLAEEEEGPEEVEQAEKCEEAEVEEVLEEVGLEDALEEAEEALDEGEDTGGAEVEVEGGPQEMGLPVGSLGEEFSDSAFEGDDKARKNKVLAEAFDGYLGAMERFYNQYLLIPQGEYIVGSKAPEKDEQPEHRVRLSPFYMGKFPVTNALFEIFVEKTGYKTTAEKLGYATVYYGRLHKKVDEKTGLVKYTFNAAIRCETVYGACWYQPFGPDSTLYDKRNHPVVQVSLEDAMAFAAWTGKRLPTENEWEAAARTADGRVFPWGNDMKGNSCNIEESSVADTTVVNKYIEFENDFGIVDAIGNVLEWTLDTCEPPSYVKNTSIYRIVKGGSWISDNDVRLFSRFRWNGQLPSNILGFRCVAF